MAALMMTMLGTGGNTETEIMSALQLNGIQTNNIHQEYKTLQDYMNNALTNDVIISIANGLFPKLGLQFHPQYQKGVQDYYQSEITPLDFAGNSEGSRKFINQWASNKTNNLIKNVLPMGSVTPLSVLFLVNAIYFKGDWELQFDKNKTKPNDFYVTPSSIMQVDMMNIRTDKFRSGTNSQLDCKILELPYKGGLFSMVLLLPNSLDGLSDLETKLTPALLNSIESDLIKQETIVSIPKFEMLSTFNLKNPLMSLGIRDLLDPFQADFSKMFSNPSSDIAVTSVVHKAFVRVDEEGTEAAAVTVIGIGITSVQPPPFTFIANHPFMFLIREKQTGSILFMGRYTKPKQ